MIGALLLLPQQQDPVAHYAGGASSMTAGTTTTAGQFFRFLFSTVPQWVQIAGIVIGGPVALIVVWQLWKHRRAVWAWWLSRSMFARVVMASTLFILGAGALTTGLVGYNYMMHQNDFCQSCHVMDVAWNRFQTTKHKELQCHACHRQPLYVSSVELFWWVTERRMRVPPHDKVPTAVCSECHMQKGTDSTLTLVTLTAGHALHLGSDSSALKNVQCVTCHGRDFHAFVPNNASCAQSGCHMLTKVNLGAMSSKGFPHCTVCHDFRGRVPPGTNVMQAKASLMPKAENCVRCHAMQNKMADYDLAADPHKGNCGSCHDAHKQKEPKEAFKTCATAQCHASADTLTAFHRGLGGHPLSDCGACHQAHSWKVKGTDCLACHKTINLDRPKAAKRVGAVFRPTRHLHAVRHKGASRPAAVRFASFTVRTATARVVPQARDTSFRHSRHASLKCTDCHGTTATHGEIKIVAPAGCLGCHHGAEQRASCTTCHTQALGPYTVNATFVISARPTPVTRPLSFAHARHSSLACTSCHGTDTKRTVATTCATCHANHHTPTADCASCHPTARVGHDRAAHDGCARCHTDARVASLQALRPVCLTCHEDKRTHYPTGDCATCHVLDHAMLRNGSPGPAR